MNENKIPLVSICIPTYNGAKYIEAAMQSALRQTYPNLEIIVSDDASTDSTLRKIEKYKEQTRIPIYIYEHEPSGIGANWNHSVSKSSGDYIKFLFQDDLLEPDCISKLMKTTLEDDNIGLVYCKRNFIFESLTPKISDFIFNYGKLHEYWGDLKIEAGILDGTVYLKDNELLNSPKNKIGEPSAVLINKKVFKSVGFFDETLKQTLDCEFWYRVMTRYKIGFVDEELMSFRLHDDQASAKNKKEDIPDNHLLYYYYYKRIYAFLNLKNKLKLLKLYHPLFKLLAGLKRRALKTNVK